MGLPRRRGRQLCLAVSALALLTIPVEGKKSQTDVPPRVRKNAPKTWGGGSPDHPKHLQPMQKQSSPEPLAELTEAGDWDTFYTEYIRKNRPVVFRNVAKSQKGFDLWTDEYLRKNFGSKEVQVEVNKSETRGGKSKSMKFSKFISEMYKEEREGQYYAIVDFDQDKKAKKDFSLPEPISCKEILPQSMTLWMSSGGTTSVLHCDDAENVLMLLDGKKTVMLVHQDQAQSMYARIAEHRGSSPVHQDAVDHVAFPKFVDMPWIYGEINAGDMLYIPHTYWHQVNSFGRNLAVNLWWQHEEDWRWWDPENEKEYQSVMFGTEKFPKFDDLKSRGAAKTKCTPLAEGTDLSKVKFMDDAKFKQYAKKKRKQHKDEL